MVWVVFTEKFKFTPHRDRRVSIVYKPSDDPRQVTKECAEKAVAAGKARRSQKPRKTADDMPPPADPPASETAPESGNEDAA